MDRNPQPVTGDALRRAGSRLRLVTDDDRGSSVFDDLDTLRQELPPVLTRRARSVETFARIPHARGYELARRKLSGAAWALLIELDRLILMVRSQNPVRLTYRAREAIGLSRHPASFRAPVPRFLSLFSSCLCLRSLRGNGC
jgi:hypothetical protein